jgi:uncharacterized membrane protein YfcA
MDIKISLASLIYIFLVSTLGATLQGSVGFGLGFVAVPLLAVIDPRYLPGPLIMAALVLTILLAHREHESIQLKGITWILVGRLIGALIGIRLLVLIPKEYLSLTFAGMVILGVILSVSGLRLDLKPKNLLSMGTLSGLMATTSAIGGPPLALIYQYLKGPEFRGTLSGIFVVGAIFSLLALSTAGYFAFKELKLALILLPGIVSGFFLSKYTAKILDRGFIRPAILTFSMLSGIALLIKTLYHY